MRRIIYLLTALVMMAVSSTPVHAAVGDVINIRFSSPYSPYTGGAAADAPSIWNAFPATYVPSQPLLYSNGGTVTGASLTFSADNYSSINPASTAMISGDKNLMLGYLLDTGTLGINISIAGLSAGNYDLYVYSQRETDNTSHLKFTANNVTPTLMVNSGNSSSLALNTNYIKTSIKVANNGLFTLTSLGNDTEINGFQLKETAPTPEPASLVSGETSVTTV